MVSTILAATLTEACGEEPGFICEAVFDATSNETLAEVADFLVKPLKVLLILFAAWFINRVLRRMIDRSVARIVAQQSRKLEAVEAPGADDHVPRRMEAFQALARRRREMRSIQIERGEQRAETLGAVLRSIAAVAVYSIAVAMALGEFDVNLGPLIASAGVVGVALGFGAQSLVKDFLSGVFMLLEDQYGVGDIVDVGEAAGVVEAVNLRTTQLRDVTGTLWHVPNGEIRRVANKSQQWARAVLDIDVAYDTDLTHAMNVIKQVADDLWNEALPQATVLEEPQIFGVQAFGPDAVTIRLGVKTEPAEQFATERELRARIKRAFDEEGIEIPFPQRVVWMHHVSAADEKAKPEVHEPAEPAFRPVVAEGEVDD